MPKKIRGKMLISGFGFPALGLLAAAAIGWIILEIYPQVAAWRWVLRFSLPLLFCFFA